MLKVFLHDSDIGIIGCSGATVLSTHGIALQSEKRCGKIFLGNDQQLISWSEINENYQEVEAIDGFLIATQYDIPWREDLFDSDDDTFGVSAQCIEFKRKGYKTVVINQMIPWILSKNDNFKVVLQAQKNFLNEYSSELFPKVLVIIPTYNRSQYFRVALDSVLNQTYRNLKIVISDDSTNEETENLMQPYLNKYSNITYFRNRGFNGDSNWNFLRKYQMDEDECEYVNWLMDDDIFFPRKIEIMVELFRNNPGVSLVTSPRGLMDVEGKITPVYREGLFKIEGNEAGKLIFKKDNYIGEPTTALMKKSCLRNNDLCWNDDENGFFSLVDVSTWLSLLSRGDLIIYPESLSATRTHDNRGSNQSETGILYCIDYAKEIWTAWEKKIFLKTEDDIYEALLIWFVRTTKVMLDAHEKNFKNEALLSLLKEVFVETVKAFSNGYEMKYKIKSRGVDF